MNLRYLIILASNLNYLGRTNWYPIRSISHEISGMLKVGDNRYFVPHIKGQQSLLTFYVRVTWQQKYFLSPADFTPSAFKYEESKTPIARLKTLNLSDEPKILEFQNLPKTRLKMIFKWNKSLKHHFWGYLATKVPFFAPENDHFQ